MVSGLIFMPLNHFEFIVVHGVKECSNLTVLYVIVQFFQQNSSKRLSFLHCIFLPSLSWIN